MGTMTQPTNDSMTCKGCGRDLPLSAFKLTRWGTHAKICNDCVAEKRTETRYNHTQMGGGEPLPFPIRTSTGGQSATFGV